MRNRPVDKQKPESTVTPKPTEKPSETQKERQPGEAGIAVRIFFSIAEAASELRAGSAAYRQGVSIFQPADIPPEPDIYIRTAFCPVVGNGAVSNGKQPPLLRQEDQEEIGRHRGL